MYGPAVTHAPDRWAGGPLFDRLDASFGWATHQGALQLRHAVAQRSCSHDVAREYQYQEDKWLTGYGDGAGAKLFPVIFGEFGSFFDRVCHSPPT